MGSHVWYNDEQLVEVPFRPSSSNGTEYNEQKTNIVFIRPLTNRTDNIRSVTQDSTKRAYIQCLYSAISGHTKRSYTDHTVLPANYTMPAFMFRKRSSDGATPNCGGRHLIGA